MDHALTVFDKRTKPDTWIKSQEMQEDRALRISQMQKAEVYVVTARKSDLTELFKAESRSQPCLIAACRLSLVASGTILDIFIIRQKKYSLLSHNSIPIPKP